MNKPKYKLIIFDCDGVLVDSEPLANQVFCELLTEHGHQPDVAQIQKAMYGITLPQRLEMASRLFNWDPPEDFLPRFHERLIALTQTGLQPVAGIHTLLENLHTPKCVASNGYRTEIDLRLQTCELTHFFGNAIFSGMEVPNPKPAPDVYLAAAQSFNIRPEECIVIEDSIPGVTAGVRAGMRVYGHAAFTPMESLRQAGAIPFANMQELLQILS